MNKYLHTLCILVCIAFCSTDAYARFQTLYSKVTVTSDFDGGLVYVVANRDKNPSESDYKKEMEASHSAFELTSSATHTYYIKAKVASASADNLTFAGWYYGNTLYSTDENLSISVPTSSADANKPATQSYKAHFIEKPAITLQSDWRLTTKAVPESNKVGEEVTLSAEVTKLRWLGDPLRQTNMLYEFDHWEDADGNVLSYEPTFKYTPTAPVTIVAVGKDLSVNPEPGKYYRVRNMVNRVLKLEGNFAIDRTKDKDPAGGQGLMASYSLLRWALPTGHDYNAFVTWVSGNKFDYTDDAEPIEVETSPGTIFYFSGNASGNEIKKLSVSSQGVDTHTLMGAYMTLMPMNDEYPGHYYFYGTGKAGFKMRVRGVDNLGACDVYLGTSENSDSYCSMVLQPIDEEHIDRYWFGAKPDEALFFEGAYWTSMYTAFPYECRDGVEAYYVKEVTAANGTSYACLTRIDGDRVPQNTAVLLKCNGLTSKENRLLPLDPAKAEGNIPALEGNMLKGTCQLYSDRDKNGRTQFDESNMRVLGVNSKGEVGFYKLKPTEDGGPAELLANKAYLDMQSFSTGQAAASFKLIMGNEGQTAIDSIEEDGSSVKYDNLPVFDLNGMPVKSPEVGNIYIVGGKKVIWK